jgi:hypothetical protein
MAHYAELNENNEVIYVAYMDNEIITDENGNEVEQLGINYLHKHHGKEKRWVRTSYGANFRRKYAGIGDTYIEDLDVFIEPKPYPSFVLNEETIQWESPIGPPPELTEEQAQSELSYNYSWSEENQEWVLNISNDGGLPA